MRIISVERLVALPIGLKAPNLNLTEELWSWTWWKREIICTEDQTEPAGFVVSLQFKCTKIGQDKRIIYGRKFVKTQKFFFEYPTVLKIISKQILYWSQHPKNGSHQYFLTAFVDRESVLAV